MIELNDRITVSTHLMDHVRFLSKNVHWQFWRLFVLGIRYGDGNCCIGQALKHPPASSGDWCLSSRVVCTSKFSIYVCVYVIRIYVYVCRKILQTNNIKFTVYMQVYLYIQISANVYLCIIFHIDFTIWTCFWSYKVNDWTRYVHIAVLLDYFAYAWFCYIAYIELLWIVNFIHTTAKHVK